MTEEEIKIYLHDGTIMRLRKWFPEGGGSILSINNQDTLAANDDDSSRYLMERVVKALRESVYSLFNPEDIDKP